MVPFDAYNPKHREYYLEFVKYKTWGKCPVRFMADGLYGDLVTHINRKMLDYYIHSEFNYENKDTNTYVTSVTSGPSGPVRPEQSVQAKGRTKRKAKVPA